MAVGGGNDAVRVLMKWGNTGMGLTEGVLCF